LACCHSCRQTVPGARPDSCVLNLRSPAIPELCA
jgi:hypothetical protein